MLWCMRACMHAQSWPTLCNPIDCSLPGSSVHGILQARILEWVAMPSSRGSSQPWGQTCTLAFPALWADSVPTEPPVKLIWYGSIIKMPCNYQNHLNHLACDELVGRCELVGKKPCEWPVKQTLLLVKE